MIPSTPRIVAIDDAQEDLTGLMKGLNRLGVACNPINFDADTEQISPCPHIRVVFTDLHLNESGSSSDHLQHFSVIGSLLEDAIKPTGPYVLILWTRYSDQASALQEFLDERLENTPKPLTVEAIDKLVYLNPEDDTGSIENLVARINDLFGNQPQISALLNWEERVLGAAAETTASVFNLAVGPNRGDEVGKLLARLAVEAAGKDRILQLPDENVNEGRFKAVNEALLPILADHISNMRLNSDDSDYWKAAFTSSDVNKAFTAEEAAKLNTRVHIASALGINGSDRGAVVLLPNSYAEEFEQFFGLSQEVAAKKQFRCREFVENDEQFSWVLVQSQAACDFAQKQPGTLPYYLGLDLPESNKGAGTPPVALWGSPPFEFNGNVRTLHVNVRFPVSLSNIEGSCQTLLYRLREQLINDLVFKIHSYGARPGIISFRETRAGN